jgi:hypothetical protein
LRTKMGLLYLFDLNLINYLQTELGFVLFCLN